MFSLVCSAGTGFVVASLDKDALSLKANGFEGGWEAASSTFGDAEVCFGATSMLVDGALRFLFFTWCGPSVPAVRRGRVSLQKNGVYNAFEGVVCEVFVTEREGLAADAIAASVCKTLSKSCVEL